VQPSAQVIPEFRETLLTQLATHLLGARDFARVGQVLQSALAKSAGPTASMHFLLGLALMESSQFAEAAEQMRQCLAKRNQPALSPVHKEIRTVAPAHCLAVCLKMLQQNEAATKAFQAALAEDPRSRILRLDYVRFLLDAGQPVESLQLLHQLVTEKPDDFDAWLLGGQIALLRPDFLEFACDWTGEAIKHFPSDRGLLSLRAEALLLNQQIEPALSLWQRWQDPANARHGAALVLCQCLCGQEPTCPSDKERTVSQEFLKWYRKLISYGANAVVGALNGKLSLLKAAVPSATRLLEQALLEAGAEAAV
jgi:tetratricopeptide (TPR) repeat protein